MQYTLDRVRQKRKKQLSAMNLQIAKCSRNEANSLVWSNKKQIWNGFGLD